jgi:hypothetical protein
MELAMNMIFGLNICINARFIISFFWSTKVVKTRQIFANTVTFC